jgi:DNA polymerase-3 subunit alpha
VVISPQPVAELVPVFKTKTRDRERGEVEVIATQYNMNDLEKAGMLKMDFLGLTALTIIEDCLRSIEQETGCRPDLTQIPTDDPATLKLFGDGETDAIFQFEGDGISEIARRLKPSSLDDIVALNALYRPGPLDSGMVDDYIERRHGRRRVTYEFKELKDVLESTYGVPVFQEQIMAIFQRLAGYSLGEADLVRRAMGKKKREELDAHKAKFIAQAMERGHDRAKLEKLWQQLEGFADYAFNKCITGEATLRDAVTGATVTVAEIAHRQQETADATPFLTWSWNGKEVVANELVEVFPTGEKEVVEIELEDGRTLRCTLDHKFYTRDATGQGRFLPLREILAQGLALYTCDQLPAMEIKPANDEVSIQPSRLESTLDTTACVHI